MSFGGACATNTTKLFEISGQVPTATRNSSLWAEAYGAIAMAMAASVYAKNHMQDAPTSVKFYINNTTVIDCLKTMEWQQNQPPKTTSAEHESLQELCTLHKNYKK